MAVLITSPEGLISLPKGLITLPEDLNIEILQYLSSKELLQCALVCRSISQLATEQLQIINWADMAREQRSLDYMFERFGQMCTWEAGMADMAREPRSLDYMRKRFGQMCTWEADMAEAGHPVLLQLFDVTFYFSLKYNTRERIQVVFPHQRVCNGMDALFTTPDLLERLGPGTFSLADLRRLQIIKDKTLALYFLRVAAAEAGTALAFKVKHASDDHSLLKEILKCRFDEADAYVVSWNHEGALYITVYQLAAGMVKLKTVLHTADCKWTQLYPGPVASQLPTQGQFECMYALSRMVSSACCGIRVTAEFNPYFRAVQPDGNISTIINLGQGPEPRDADTDAFTFEHQSIPENAANVLRHVFGP